jgi:hypothetical protein
MFDLGALQFCPSVREVYLVTQDRFGESALACFAPTGGDDNHRDTGNISGERGNNYERGVNLIGSDGNSGNEADLTYSDSDDSNGACLGKPESESEPEGFTLQWVFTCSEASKALGRISL